VELKIIIKNKIFDYLDELKEKGIERQQIAAMMGISKQTLDSLAKSSNPTVKSLIRLAETINTDWRNLIDYRIEED
jgi:transcriptional regulator with XRE-family HTH domain